MSISFGTIIIGHGLRSDEKMPVVGIGVDIVEVSRIRHLHRRYGDRFLTRVYDAREIEYCFRFKDPYPHLAARWAAKEAVAKALGTGFAKGIHWTSIVTVNLPWGEPVAFLFGSAHERASALKVAKVWLSLAHSEHYAVACAVLES
ncbi:MAG: holo-ACP synthase [Armatimonadetes bacterium]|nr:holo-ACP synthase [Armatimonadota bacterium]MDW8122625.1 holo-ACP synthase [Armatimonadota bacterium]